MEQHTHLLKLINQLNAKIKEQKYKIDRLETFSLNLLQERKSKKNMQIFKSILKEKKEDF